MVDKDFSTDEKIRQAVLEALIGALSDNEQTSSLELRVGVLNGIVHLGGSLKSLDAWEKAQEIAAQIPGIRGVVNRIEAPGAPAPSRIIHLDLSPGTSLREHPREKELKENTNEEQP